MSVNNEIKYPIKSHKRLRQVDIRDNNSIIFSEYLINISLPYIKPPHDHSPNLTQLTTTSSNNSSYEMAMVKEIAVDNDLTDNLRYIYEINECDFEECVIHLYNLHARNISSSEYLESLNIMNDIIEKYKLRKQHPCEIRLRFKLDLLFYSKGEMITIEKINSNKCEIDYGCFFGEKEVVLAKWANGKIDIIEKELVELYE